METLIIYRKNNLNIINRVTSNKTYPDDEIQNIVNGMGGLKTDYDYLIIPNFPTDKSVELYKDSNDKIQYKITDDLDPIKGRKLSYFNKKCEEVINSGFKSNSNGHIFSFDIEAQSNLNQKATMLALDSKGTIQSIPWKTKDAGLISLTRDQFITLLSEAEQHKLSVLNHYWNLESKLKSATSLGELEMIVW